MKARLGLVSEAIHLIESSMSFENLRCKDSAMLLEALSKLRFFLKEIEA